MAMRLLALLAIAFAALAPAGAASRTAAPAPIRGAPLGVSGLRLLVSDSPPFVLDVDRGTLTRLRLAGTELGPVSVVPVGGRGAVVAAGGRLHGVRGARTVSLPRADRVVAAPGESVWLEARSGRRCTVRRVALTGSVLGAARVLPCGTWSDPPGGSLGVVVGRTRVVDPQSGRTVLTTRGGILAVAGRKLVLSRGDSLVLLDSVTGAERDLGWPSVILRSSQTGLAETAADPRGRYVAIGFGDPAFGLGATQLLDVWVLDTRTETLAHVPSMPAEAGLKRTSLTWSAGGRLVVLGESGSRTIVATWRPGDDVLRVKPMRLPERDGGSDSFAVLRSLAR